MATAKLDFGSLTNVCQADLCGRPIGGARMAGQ